jgi:hypothetical protein
MDDRFRFFGFTSKIFFAARITDVCSMSSSSKSSKSGSPAEEKSSIKNSTHRSMYKAPAANELWFCADDESVAIDQIGTVVRVPCLCGGESVAESGECIDDADAATGETDVAARVFLPDRFEGECLRMPGSASSRRGGEWWDGRKWGGVERANTGEEMGFALGSPRETGYLGFTRRGTGWPG